MEDISLSQHPALYSAIVLGIFIVFVLPKILPMYFKHRKHQKAKETAQYKKGKAVQTMRDDISANSDSLKEHQTECKESTEKLIGRISHLETEVTKLNSAIESQRASRKVQHNEVMAALKLLAGVESKSVA